MKPKNEKQKTQKQEDTKQGQSGDPKLDAVIKKHKDNIDEVNLQALADCLLSDFMYYDVDYLNRRIIQVLEKAMGKADFSDKQAQDSFKRLFLEKAKAIKELTDVKLELDKGDDESRHNKVEPVLHHVIGMLINDDFWKKDEEWLEKYILENNRVFVLNIIKHYMESLFNSMDFSLNQSYVNGERILFGSDKAQLSLKRLDSILKMKSPSMP